MEYLIKGKSKTVGEGSWKIKAKNKDELTQILNDIGIEPYRIDAWDNIAGAKDIKTAERIMAEAVKNNSCINN